jgi:hypothetical protein
MSHRWSAVMMNLTVGKTCLIGDQSCSVNSTKDMAEMVAVVLHHKCVLRVLSHQLWWTMSCDERRGLLTMVQDTSHLAIVKGSNIVRLGSQSSSVSCRGLQRSTELKALVTSVWKSGRCLDVVRNSFSCRSAVRQRSYRQHLIQHGSNVDLIEVHMWWQPID